jgi:hypothetical protein
MTMLANFFLMFLLILRHLYTSKYLAILIVIIELTHWIKNTHIYENLFDSGLIVLVWNLFWKYQLNLKFLSR